jgi:hypothetical protein
MQLPFAALLLLLYCLTGAIFLVAYILAMAPPKQATTLGLIMLFWPLVLLVEAALVLASQFGKVGSSFAERLKKGHAN